MFNDFDDIFTRDEELGQYISYAAYNSDLLQVVDFYGQTPFDWYRNKRTGQIIWLDGRAQIDGYSNLGHTWGKTFPNNNDRILLDGETKLITYNDKVIYDFAKRSSDWSKKKSSFFSDGYALSDGGNYQNPNALRSGGRNVVWIDFGGLLEALTTIFAFELRGNKPKGKGTNGGKPTIENKIDDGINAFDFGANGIKATKSATEEADRRRKNPVSSQKLEYIQIVNDPENPNKNEYIRRDIYEAQQKKKNEK